MLEISDFCCSTAELFAFLSCAA